MIKVFIIDDSLMVRNSIIKILKDEPTIKVIGEAVNPVDAMDVFKKVGFPDVFILDIEMPKMDGLTFFKKLNDQNPTPVIICSTLVSLGSSTAIDALRLGAVEIIQKPNVGVKDFFLEQKEEIVRAIKTASRAKIKYKPKIDEKKSVQNIAIQEGQPATSFIAIGSSTGGVQVIEEILTSIEPNHKAIVITQHMPQGFTASFANRLNNLTSSKVVEAQDGEILTDNKVIIAQGGIHMEVVQDGEYYKVKLKDFPKVNSHKPSVNVLFNSIAKICDKNVLAFILTGMGDDGATGLKKLKDKGIETYGQNEESCAVYGMPNVAFQIGAVKNELNIQQIVNKINNFKG
jgi:two-component system chemotaxis response regulator CheB